MSIKKLPILLVSGYLGAGKTTLLSQIINHPDLQRRRIAIIVNDMSEINIDSILLEKSPIQQLDSMIEFSNGCICCSLREELFNTIHKISSEQKYDYMIIESTGISEPSKIIYNFDHPLDDGRELKDICYFDNLITMIDGVNFMEDFSSIKRIHGVDESDHRHVTEILVEQIEFSSTIIINKTDLISESDLKQIKSIVKSINSKAILHETSNGKINPTNIMNKKIYQKELISKSATWLQSIQSKSSLSEIDEYNLQSFVWRSRQPLNPEKFFQLLQIGDFFQGIIRIKGFFWLASRPHAIGLLNKSGKLVTTRYGGKWWMYTPKEKWPKNPQIISTINSRWDSEVGDCRQELVFIGQALNTEKICEHLNLCLIQSDEEIYHIKDPFPAWNTA